MCCTRKVKVLGNPVSHLSYPGGRREGCCLASQLCQGSRLPGTSLGVAENPPHFGLEAEGIEDGVVAETSKEPEDKGPG